MDDPWESADWPGWQQPARSRPRRRRRWPLVLLGLLALWQLSAIIPDNAGLSCAQAASRDGHATAHTVTVVSIACPVKRSWHLDRWPVPIARGSAFRVAAGHWLTAGHVVEREGVPSGYELRWYAIDRSRVIPRGCTTYTELRAWTRRASTRTRRGR